MKALILFAVFVLFSFTVSEASLAVEKESHRNDMAEYMEMVKGIHGESRGCIKLGDECEEDDGENCCNWGINGCNCIIKTDTVPQFWDLLVKRYKKPDASKICFCKKRAWIPD